MFLELAAAENSNLDPLVSSNWLAGSQENMCVCATDGHSCLQFFGGGGGGGSTQDLMICMDIVPS